MKPIAFIAIALLSIAGLIQRAAAQDYYFDDEPHPNFHSDQVTTFLSTPIPWSVTGQWHYAGPAWRGMIDLRDDGTFSRAGDGQSGKWKLGAEDDHFLLILKWSHFPQDTVTFMTPTLFQGEAAKGEIIIRRLPVVAAVAPPAAPAPIPHFDKSQLTRQQFAACAAFKAKAGAFLAASGHSRMAEYEQLEHLGIFPGFSSAAKSSKRDALAMEPPSFLITPAQLTDLLGKPDSAAKNTLDYSLGGDGGRASVLAIRIRDGHLCERIIVTTKS